MKPLSQISPLRSLRDEQAPIGSRLKHPLTDYHYQAAGSDPRGASDRLNLSSPSFRDLSNEFLGAEMKRDYLAEAFFFAIIVGVSVWPIVSMLRALSVLLK
jgi:hypothetical protein